MNKISMRESEIYRKCLLAFIAFCLLFGWTDHVFSQKLTAIALSDTAWANKLIQRSVAKSGFCNLLRISSCDSIISDISQALQYVESGDKSIDSLQWINLYYILGDVYHRKRQFAEAVEYLKKGIAFADITIGRNCKEVADCYSLLGLIEEFRQSYHSAIQYHQTALSIWHTVKPGEPLDIAKCHQRLGACYGNIKDRQREKEHLTFALSICQQEAYSHTAKCAGILIDMAGSAANSGQLDEATALFRQIVDDSAVSDRQKSIAWQRLANILYRRGDYSGAARAFERHIDLQEAIVGAYDPWLTIPYTDLGNVYELLQDTSGALRCYRHSIEITRRNYPYLHYSIGGNQYRIASLYARLGRFEEALSMVQQSLMTLCPGFDGEDVFHNPSIEKSTNYDYLRRALSLKAQLLFVLAKSNISLKNNYLQHARKTYDLCIGLIEQKRNDLPTTVAQANTISDVFTVYEQAILAELENIKENKEPNMGVAFMINEKSKSFLLYAAVQEKVAMQFARIPDSLRQKELYLKSRISALDIQRNQEESKQERKNDSLLMTITSRLLEMRWQYESLIQSFEVQCPDYYRLKYDLRVESVENVQQNLLQPDQALLEYFVGDSSIFIFLVKKDDYRVFEVKKDFPLEDWVKQLRHGIYGYHTASNRTDVLRDSCTGTYIGSATALYQKLLAPVDSLLPRRVVIVPDGALGYLPFEALLTGLPVRKDRFHEYPYFGRQKDHEHSISYCYSATLLREMTEKQHRRKPEKMLAAFAPYYDGDTSVLVGLDDLLATRSVAPGDLEPLRHSGAEVAAAQKLLGGDVFTDTMATEECFNLVAGDYRILHLSTHGKADDRAGDYSYLVFSPRKDSLENELLFCRDIYNLSLNADLVVLSACETGIGELKRGEGIISLARAFAYAGAKSIVTTLWSVDDAKTKDFMVFFYRNLKRGMPKDEALSKARGDYFRKHGGLDAHPYFWAGFVGIGDMSRLR
ncbi:MAG: CHAT domain-containing protein [Haliscomenobacteraceae bacterium CHB4]|nr:CHAT domain-containing protein [Haliscomenobacteraceae bacterium CHB4]